MLDKNPAIRTDGPPRWLEKCYVEVLPGWRQGRHFLKDLHYLNNLANGAAACRELLAVQTVGELLTFLQSSQQLDWLPRGEGKVRVSFKVTPAGVPQIYLGDRCLGAPTHEELRSLATRRVFDQ